MKIFTPFFAARLSKRSTAFLHIALPLVLLTLISSFIYCLSVAKSDAFMGEYMFYEAIEQVLASLLISCVGAIVIDIIERDLQMP